MQRKVNIQQFQKVTADDYNNLGQFPRDSMDSLVRDAVGTNNKYVGFTVLQSSPSIVSVGNGRFYKATGEVYYNDDQGGVSIDMISHLPAVAKRIALVVVYGNTIDTDLEPRTFLVDATTRQTQGQEVATESRRQAYIDVVYGVENATPEAPSYNSNYVAVAEVTLTPSGIDTNGIAMIAANQLPSISGNAGDIDDITERLDEVGPQLDTMRSAVSSLANGLLDKADGAFVSEISAKVNALYDRIGVVNATLEVLGAAIRNLSTAKPTTSIQNYYDSALDDNIWDTAAGSWSALLQDGLRFPRSASASVQIALSNPLDPLVMVSDSIVLPAYVEKARLSVPGSPNEYALTNTTVETISVVKLSRARFVKRYRYIEGYRVLGLTYDKPGYDVEKLLFLRTGETFTTFDAYSVVEWDLRVLKGSCAYAVMRVPYFRRILNSVSWGGSVTAQTFVSPQDGYITKLDLFFTRKGSSGNVQVALCQVDAAGRPDLNNVLERATLSAADIQPDRRGTKATPIAITPTPVLKGQAYAIVLITSGPHFVSYNTGNRLSSGAFYWRYDSQWVKDSVTRDLAFSLYFAEFNSPVTEVQLAALELAGGMDSIDINADHANFDGAGLEFQIREANVWKTIGEDETTLSSKPSLVQFKAVFRGTKDVMPSLGIGTRSAVALAKPAVARTIISKAITLPSAASKIVIRDRHANWNGSYNTSTVTVLVGGSYTTVETADSVTTIIDGNDVIFEQTYDLASAQSSFKIKEVGATTDVNHCDTITQVGYVAYA